MMPASPVSQNIATALPVDKTYRCGTLSYTKMDAALPPQAWTPHSFVDKQRQLAGELHVEFLDTATVWHNYLGQSGKPWQWFQRDAVHGNDRGKQIVGRIIEAYFKP